MAWGWGENVTEIQVNKIVYNIIMTKTHQNVRKVTL